MKTKRKTSLTLAIAAIVALSGCASNTPKSCAAATGCFNGGQQDNTVTGSNAGDSATIGGIAGGLTGAAICVIAGGSPITCAAAGVGGAALGAGIGYKVGHDEDLKLAEDNAKRWTAAGFTTQTASSEVKVAGQQGQGQGQGQGQQQVVQKLDKVDIDIPVAMLASKSVALNNLLFDAGKMSADSKFRYIYSIHAKTKKDADYLLSKIQSGAAPKNVMSSWLQSDKTKLVMEVLPS